MGSPKMMASGSFCDACLPGAKDVLVPDEATYLAHEVKMRTSPWAEKRESFRRLMKRATRSYIEIIAKAGQRASAERRPFDADDLVVGMLEQRGCVALVALERVGVDVAALLRDVELAPRPSLSDSEPHSQIASARKILDAVEGVADSLGDAHVGSEHMLLAAISKGNIHLQGALGRIGKSVDDLSATIKAIDGRDQLG